MCLRLCQRKWNSFVRVSPPPRHVTVADPGARSRSCLRGAGNTAKTTSRRGPQFIHSEENIVCELKSFLPAVLNCFQVRLSDPLRSAGFAWSNSART